MFQENNLKEVNSNFVALRKNHLELLELKNMLKKTEIFLEESRLGFSDADENTSKHTLPIGLLSSYPT